MSDSDRDPSPDMDDPTLRASLETNPGNPNNQEEESLFVSDSETEDMAGPRNTQRGLTTESDLEEGEIRESSLEEGEIRESSLEDGRVREDSLEDGEIREDDLNNRAAQQSGSPAPQQPTFVPAPFPPPYPLSQPAQPAPKTTIQVPPPNNRPTTQTTRPPPLVHISTLPPGTTVETYPAHTINTQGRIQIFDKAIRAPREIWQPSDGNGTPNLEPLGPNARVLTIHPSQPRMRLYQSPTIAPDRRHTSYPSHLPPKHVVLDDQAAYDLITSNIMRKHLHQWWPHDFNINGRVLKKRPHRGLAAIRNPNVDGDGRYHSVDLGDRVRGRYVFCGATDYVPVVWGPGEDGAGGSQGQGQVVQGGPVMLGGGYGVQSNGGQGSSARPSNDLPNGGQNPFEEDSGSDTGGGAKEGGREGNEEEEEDQEAGVGDIGEEEEEVPGERGGSQERSGPGEEDIGGGFPSLEERLNVQAEELNRMADELEQKEEELKRKDDEIAELKMLLSKE